MKKLICLFVAVVLLSGCGVTRGIVAGTNRSKLNSLEMGMTKDQVLALMGKPYKREAYEGVEYWLYETEWISDGVTTDEELTPIAFKNGKVDGWGRNYYQDRKKRVEADINIKQETPK